MKKVINLYSILGVSFFALFLILFGLLSFDKANITGIGEVGLSKFNNIIKYKYNEGWQIFADIFLYLGIALAALLAIVGFVQLIKRKSLFKVDRYIVICGIFLILAIFLWIMFDKVIIVNYRPIYHTDVEPSFPSTHTFLVIFIYLSAHNIACMLSENKKIKYGTLVAAILISVLVSLSRVLSGMHYITDVIAGVFLGLSLYFLCFGLINNSSEENVDE